MSEFPTFPSAPAPTLRELFDLAMEQPAAARSAWLCLHVADPVLRARVARLLELAAAPGALDISAADRAAGIGEPVSLQSDAWVGRRIGAFRLVRPIGEGGMAVVFLGERDDPALRQQVAVKLLRRGLMSDLDQRMFVRERQALAALSHPNIARFIDGGVADGGVPFLVMEYVDGQPIDQHAAKARLDVRARVAAMVDACLAVAAAHRALIVHRDLKPSNILVDRDGRVKLLDFGIAKMLDGDASLLQTEFAAMTPAYAAPEQREAGVISTATDVYSLGAVLYELLLGARPRPATTQRASSCIDASAVTAAGLPTDGAALRADLAGDLDNILAKALDPEPARRYADAAALADDLQRYLDGQPVSAYPPSRRYRARKFVTRHKGAVASSLVFLIALIVTLGVALWQAQVAREQARLARNQSDRANATREFVVELLQTASANLPKDERPTPEALVAQAAKKAREEPDIDPLVRVQLLLTLSRVARSTGDFGEAEKLINDAIERLRGLGLPLVQDEWIAALTAKGNLLQSINRSAEADGVMKSLVPALAKVESEDAISALMLYAATRATAGDADRAVEIAQQALVKAQRVFGADSVNGIETATYLGQLCSSVRRYRESSAILDEATARWRRLGLPLNEQFARSLFHLAVAKERLGERAAVEPLYREGITLMRRVQEGPYHRLAPGLVGYARFLIGEDRFDEADVALEEALAINRQVFGDDHVRSATALAVKGLVHSARHDGPAAEAATRTAYEVLLRHAKEAGYEDVLATTRLQLADISLGLGRADAAASLLAQGATDLPRLFGVNSMEAAEGLRLEARLAMLANDDDGALARIDRALGLLQAVDPPAPSSEIRLRALRADALLALSRTRESLDESARALALLQATQPGARARLTALLAQRARIERASGDTVAADATIAEARALGISAAILSAADRETLRLDMP
jgi:serine/threonine protein kinase